MNGDAADQAVSITLKSMQTVAETALGAGKGAAKAAVRHLEKKKAKRDLLLERNLNAILKDEKNFLAFSMPEAQFALFRDEVQKSFPFAAFTDREHPGTVLLLVKKEDRSSAADAYRASLSKYEQQDEPGKKEPASRQKGRLLPFSAKDRSREETAAAVSRVPSTDGKSHLQEKMTEACSTTSLPKEIHTGKRKHRPDRSDR